MAWWWWWLQAALSWAWRVPLALGLLYSVRLALRQAYWVFFVYRNSPHGSQMPLVGDWRFIRSLGRFEGGAIRLQRFLSLDTDHFIIWFFRSPSCTVNILSPEDVKHVLKGNFDNYEKGETLREQGMPLFGDGIFLSDGGLWKTQRRLASHMFKSSLQRSYYFEVFREHFQDLDALHLRPAADSSSGNVVDVQDVFLRFTLDSIGDIALGRNIDSLRSDVPFSRAFNEAQALLVSMLVAPPGWRELFVKPKFDRAIAVLDRFAYRVIREKREQVVRGELQRGDNLLARYLLDEQKKGSGTKSSGSGLALGSDVTDATLRDQIMNFLIAGRDTTGALLTWASYLISQHPHVEEKLVSELDAVLGGKPPTADSYASLPYLEAVVKETLRMYPPVSNGIKRAVGDDVLPSGLAIKAKTMVLWSPYAMHRHPKYWDRPNDFMPGRWLGESDASSVVAVGDGGGPQPARQRANRATYRDPDALAVDVDEENTDAGFPGRHPWCYMPFNAGPRLCLGQRLAFNEARFVLASVYQKYHLEYARDSPAAVKDTIVCFAKDGMPMAIHHRER